jgi:hypothetical protein
VSSGSRSRLTAIILVISGLMLACTLPGQTPPAAKDSGAPKPAASPSPAPAAQASPTAIPPRPIVGGGAAQPRPGVTVQPVGGNAIVIVPTPNFATDPTRVPAALAPAVSLATPPAANIAQVTGTLSRIPTAIPSSGGGGAGGAGGAGSGTAAGAAVVVVAGGGGGGGAQTIPVVLTATPPVRILPQPQPAIVFPGGR